MPGFRNSRNYGVEDDGPTSTEEPPMRDVGVEPKGNPLGLRPAMLRFIKKFGDRVDVSLSEEKKFTNPLTDMMFEAYLFGRSALDPDNMCYIIGGVQEAGITFAKSPKIHEDQKAAYKEAGRLRKRHSANFFVFSGSRMALEFWKQRFGHLVAGAEPKIKQEKAPKAKTPKVSDKSVEGIKQEILKVQGQLKQYPNEDIYGLIIRGMTAEIREQWFYEISCVFGDVMLEHFRLMKPTSIVIKSLPTDLPLHVVDGFYMEGKYAIYVNVHNESPDNPMVLLADVEIPEAKYSNLIRLKRTFFSQLNGVSNKYLGTSLELALPMDDTSDT